MKRPFFAPRGHSPLERLARALLLAGVFALAMVAYRKHFDHVIEQAEAQGTIADPGHVLANADRAVALGAAQDLRRRYGLDLRLRLGGKPNPPSPDDPNTVWFYLAPDCRGSRVVAPALVASALPENLLNDLGSGHMDAACREGRPREGVLGALGVFIDALGHAAGRGKGVQHE
ncbi:TPM domain-containing protein [Solidesulfovibrio sp. C21]|uniref:TPM domain-containing protein n=1 Tax=Solidesulfovibrio sp. C21 TaxID=3398613 RepID=UPI0039FD7A16